MESFLVLLLQWTCLHYTLSMIIFRLLLLALIKGMLLVFVIPPLSHESEPFTFADISVSLVQSHLQSLYPKKSTGTEGFSAGFLKAILNEIFVPLCKIFNDSLKAGAFPSQWKQSYITPVHKGGAPIDPGNFRAISVVPTYSG